SAPPRRPPFRTGSSPHAHRLDRIDGRRAAGRGVAREDRHGEEPQRGEEEDDRIERTGPEEDGPERLRHTQGEDHTGHAPPHPPTRSPTPWPRSGSDADGPRARGGSRSPAGGGRRRELGRAHV